MTFAEAAREAQFVANREGLVILRLSFEIRDGALRWIATCAPRDGELADADLTEIDIGG